MTIKQLIEEIATPNWEKRLALMQKKGHDYSGVLDTLANLKNSAVVGVSPERAVLVRMMDKMSRLASLLDAEEQGREMQVLDEKIEDTALDLAVYSDLFQALRKERLQK